MGITVANYLDCGRIDQLRYASADPETLPTPPNLSEPKYWKLSEKISFN
jgi:hypothetical protein